MTVSTKTKRLGGSLMAIIPKKVVKKLELRENESIEIRVKRPQKSYFGICKGVSAFKEVDRFDRK
ncbi:hypothetical protein KKE06_02180 [Candidatus Micrarchaeota archaeon]|nr:hypothetical protein [Candidatus Micrarchaeota archaeon]MBU1930571.1 hypothetical protein [Candidatus Micrarchaeota archaeon]